MEIKEEWKKYSKTIAAEVSDRMAQLGISQKSLAVLMGCSQQYVSKILKGNENLSLETVSKLESSLDFSLFLNHLQLRSKPDDRVLREYSFDDGAKPVHCVAEAAVPMKSDACEPERKYRLASMEEPSDEMLQTIMEGVAKKASQTSLEAKSELDRRFREMMEQIYKYRKNQKMTWKN